jgi:hypothetical protein
MLLVVLLSAAPTGGQPGTRLVGSAFDPATVSVVVSPKKPRFASSTTSLLKKKPADDVAGEASTATGLLRISSAPQFALASRPRFSPSQDVTPGARSSLKAHGPRAPPPA